MSTQNIGFYEDLTKIIFELSSNIIKYAPSVFLLLGVETVSCFCEYPLLMFYGQLTIFFLQLPTNTLQNKAIETSFCGKTGYKLSKFITKYFSIVSFLCCS